MFNELDNQLSIFDKILDKWDKLSKAQQNVKKSIEGVADAAEDLEEAKLIEREGL